MIKKYRFSLIVVGLLLINLIGLASAFGVAGYANPINVRPGESIDLAFRLQNAGSGGEDFVVESSINAEPGLEVLLLDNITEYEVPFGSTGVRVNFRVLVSEDAEIGKNYTVSARFISRSSNEGGPLGVQLAMGDRVVIHVSDVTEDGRAITPAPEALETPKGTPIAKILILIVLVLFVVVVAYYVHKRNKERKQQ